MVLAKRLAQSSRQTGSAIASSKSAISNAVATSASNGSRRQTADVSTLEADTQTEREFKYSTEVERKVRDWLEAVLDCTLDADFHSALKSGQVLCRLFHKLFPSEPTIKIYDGSVAYLQMQNISFYLTACQRMGMKQIDLFDTTDLFDRKNLK